MSEAPDNLAGDDAATAGAITLLKKRGFPSAPVEFLKGWSNRVWLAPSHAVRLSSGRYRESLAHEARVDKLVDGKVCMPHIIEHGELEGRVSGQANPREWMISQRMPGQSLLDAWPEMGLVERRDAARQLGQTLRALHEVDLPQAFENPWLSDAVADGGKIVDGYRIAPQLHTVTAANLRHLGFIEDSLIDRAEAFIAERLPIFEGDTDVLIHADPHFNNVIWDGTNLTLIDFEVATRAPRDRELQTLIEFWRDPSMVYAHDTPPEERLVRRDDVKELLLDIRSVYSQMFSVPNLRDRLEVYEVTGMFHVLQYFASGSSWDPRLALDKALEGEFDLPDFI